MRSLPDPGAPGDDGAPDPDLREALRAYARDSRPGPVIAALCGARLLVPVIALLAESGTDEGGRTVDKRSDMAAVLLTGRDGRRALLAFTGADAMTAWDDAARPVPVSARQAATAAIQEAAAALVLDVAGPVRLAVETDDLAHLAAGDRLLAMPGGHAWVPAV